MLGMMGVIYRRFRMVGVVSINYKIKWNGMEWSRVVEFRGYDLGHDGLSMQKAC